MRESCTRLRVQMPIRIRNGLSTKFRIRSVELEALGALDIDYPIHNDVRDMNTFGPEFSCQ